MSPIDICIPLYTYTYAYVYVELIHFIIQQKLTQYCQTTIPLFFKKRIKTVYS